MKAEKLNIYDTVQVFYYSNLKTEMKGFIITKKSHTMLNLYDDVAIVFNRQIVPAFLGNNLRVMICRLVLVEKHDRKRQKAIEYIFSTTKV